MAIQSFVDAQVESFFSGGRPPAKAGWRGVAKIVLRKLDMLHYAQALDDLRSPPGNRLELLKGNFQGHFSIRVNDQWRIVFIWTTQGPDAVQVLDYH